MKQMATTSLLTLHQLHELYWYTDSKDSPDIWLQFAGYLAIFHIRFRTKPTGMQASIFGACPSQNKLEGLWQERHQA